MRFFLILCLGSIGFYFLSDFYFKQYIHFPQQKNHAEYIQTTQSMAQFLNRYPSLELQAQYEAYTRQQSFERLKQYLDRHYETAVWQLQEWLKKIQNKSIQAPQEEQDFMVSAFLDAAILYLRGSTLSPAQKKEQILTWIKTLPPIPEIEGALKGEFEELF